ncbi:MAG TPA: sensor histidine kinase, partial [Microbacteriaceae bacterium]|nr:sensor histidine kinase [Microbacteriaceae bacterium]
MSRQSRSLSARARILGAMLLVATLGLVVVGSVTFLVQRDRVLAAIDARLDAQVQALEDVASRGASDAPNTSLLPKPEDSASSVVESIHANDFADVVTYLRVVVQRLVPGPNESSMAIIDGEPRWVPGTMVGFQVAENTEF